MLLWWVILISRVRRFLKDNKGVVTIAGAVAGGALMGTLKLDSMTAESIDANSWALAYGAVAGAGITRSLVSLASYFKNPIKDLPKILSVSLAGFFGPSRSADVKRYRKLEAKLKDVYIEGEYLKTVAGLDMLEGKIESAFNRYEQVIAVMPEPFDTGIFHKAGLSLAESIDRMQHRKEDPYKLAIQSALRWQYSGFYDDAMLYWQEALGYLPRDIDINILYGRALGSMGKKDLAMDQWKRVLKLVREENEGKGGITLERIGDAEVYKLNESDVLDNVFVIKVSDDRQALEDEVRVTRAAHDHVGSWIHDDGYEHEFAIVKTISMTKNGKHSLVSLYERGETLFDFMKGERDIYVFESVVRFLAAIHSKMPCEATKRDELLHLAERMGSTQRYLCDSGIDPDICKSAFAMIFDACETPIAVLSSSPDVFDKDAHGKNWTISQDHRVTALDFQSRGATSPENDLSKLLEMGGHFTADLDGDSYRDIFITTYHNHMFAFCKVSLPPIDEFRFRKLNADLIRAVSYFCASCSSPLNSKTRQDYLRSALHSAGRIEREYAGTLPSADMKNYSLFKRGLGSFLKIC
ncbi:MAG: hypothetical protein V1729_00020 [Candidatus Woesearchaeota archaeon]